MKNRKKLNTLALASAVLILFFIIFSSAASADTEQNASSVVSHAYIANNPDTTVSVIDTATNKVTATVPVEYGTVGVVVNPTGTKVYVTNVYGSVYVIDTATNKVTATVPVEGGPYGVAVSPDGKKVYVTTDEDNTVSVIDTATNRVTATVPVEGGPYGVAVTPNGKKVYITNRRSDNFSVIDSATNTVTAVVPSGNHSWGVAVNPDGKKAYVTNGGCVTVSIIDTSTDKVTAKVKVGTCPHGVAVNPTGTRVYVANNWDNTVSVIDTATNKVIATVPVGSSPEGVAVNPTGTKLYVTNYYSDTISVIDTTTNKVTATVNVGNGPIGVAVSPASGPMHPVANFSANPTSGKAPLTVAFTDKSTGVPTKWKWNFGDGATSSKQNPVYKYSKAGTYTVKLTVTNTAGSNTVTKTDYIKVIVKPVANFSASQISGNAPLKVTFTDKSTGSPTSWKWNFGDGKTSTAKSPTYTYSKAGKYTVSLTVKNVAGSSSKTIKNYIVVNTLKAPVAAFYASPRSGKAPLKVQFTDKSANSPTSWKWNFGDKTYSTAKNPVHKYSKAGKYTVSLTVKNAKGSNTKTISGYIVVSK